MWFDVNFEKFKYWEKLGKRKFSHRLFSRPTPSNALYRYYFSRYVKYTISSEFNYIDTGWPYSSCSHCVRPLFSGVFQVVIKYLNAVGFNGLITPWNIRSQHSGTQRKTLLIKVAQNVYTLRTNVFYHSGEICAPAFAEIEINSRLNF